MKFKLTCFRKPDLDTVTTAFVIFSHCPNPLYIVKGDACSKFLKSKQVVCIECGGSGQVDLYNFDHHCDQVLPCACKQAWLSLGSPKRYSDLVSYVNSVDTGIYDYLQGNSYTFSLSSLFSGMLFSCNTLYDQFVLGFNLLKKIYHFNISPLDTSWLINHDRDAFLYAKTKNFIFKELFNDSRNIISHSCSGLTIMSLATTYPGVHGLLFSKGADISIAINLKSNKTTISVKNTTLLNVIEKKLNAIDPGWGGPSECSIIGSPFNGSLLSYEKLILIIKNSIYNFC